MNWNYLLRKDYQFKCMCQRIRLYRWPETLKNDVDQDHTRCFYIVNKCLQCNMSLYYHHNAKPNALIVW